MTTTVLQRYDTRAWLLFSAMALLWGVPYLFIKVAVDSYSPVAIVCGRTLIGALLLLPFALRHRALRPALAHLGNGVAARLVHDVARVGHIERLQFQLQILRHVILSREVQIA